MFNKSTNYTPYTFKQILNEIYSGNLLKRNNKEIFYSMLYLFYILGISSFLIYLLVSSIGLTAVLVLGLFIYMGYKIIELQRYKEVLSHNQNVNILNGFLSKGKKEDALIFAENNKLIPPLSGIKRDMISRGLEKDDRLG